MEKQKHRRETDLSAKFGRYAPIAAIFMHLFCCGIPITLAVLSAIGLTVHIPFIEEHEHHEIFIFIFSGTLLALSYLAYLKGCKGQCCIEHKKTRDANKKILIIAVSLFFASMIIHLFGRY